MAKKPAHPLVDGLFSMDGRFRRSEYWLTNIGLSIVKALLTFLLAMALSGLEFGGMEAAQGVVSLVFLWPTTAVFVKRGHDRNRPALYSISLILAIFVLSMVMTLFANEANSLWTISAGVLIVVLAIYIVVDYGFLEGTKGRNRYGLSPKGLIGPEDRQVADVFA
jgi:uncharacterized membrane protein YhaH (DUF805 family)